MIRYLILGLAMTLVGCATTEPEMPPEAALSYQEEEYTIGVGDELRVDVWRNPDLSVVVPVRPDGMISVPLIGDILAGGKTAEDLAGDIGNNLSEYIKTPKVTVIVMTPASTDYQQRVRVTGAVENPSSLPYRKGMTVLDLVLSVGGLNEFASGNKAKLYRTVDGVTKVYSVKLDNILEDGDLSTNYNLAPGDMVSVPERNF